MLWFLFQIAFELMSVIAVITNCALIGLSEEVRAHLPDIGDANMVLIFVAAEVRCLFIREWCQYLITLQQGHELVVQSQPTYAKP